MSARSKIDSDFYVDVDSFVVDLRCDVVLKEAINMVRGVNTDGCHEVFGFYVGGIESATIWKVMLKDLKCRGLEKVLLVIGNVPPGLYGLTRRYFRKRIHSRA